MECALNLLWAALAAVMMRHWMRYAPRKGATRWVQAVALGASLLILFPVISLTDDLLVAQNPTDTLTLCSRREHVVAGPCSIFNGDAAPPPPVLSLISISFVRVGAPFYLPVLAVDNATLACIRSRPPPVA
jgi:hypothetical protein